MNFGIRSLAALCTSVACLALVTAVVAQTPVVPPSGDVNLKKMPLMGEDVYGALQTSRLDNHPLQSHFGNTRVRLATGLWECHDWYDADGTGVEFCAIKKADGSMQLGTTDFTYRVDGKPGDYHLCRKPVGASDEVCEKQKFDQTHYLYDEWFQNYDRPASAGMPAYKNVHERHALIAGHQ